MMRPRLGLCLFKIAQSCLAYSPARRPVRRVLFDTAFSAWCLRARTACVSNIEQLPQVCSAMIVGGVDGERGVCSRLDGNPEPYNGLFSSIPNRD